MVSKTGDLCHILSTPTTPQTTDKSIENEMNNSGVDTGIIVYEKLLISPT
jgi:hypothetical protein